MTHFKDYKEYQSLCLEMGLSAEKPQSELVLEDNTIYEIDLTCEKCLRYFGRKKARQEQEKGKSGK